MPKNYQKIMKAEWSVMIDVAKLGIEPKTYRIEATEEERADLSRRYGIVSIESAEAIITLQKTRGNMIHAMGSLRAEVIQACVVSLEPVPQSIEDEFEGWFGDDDSAVSFARAKSDREAVKSGLETEILEESVDPEPIIDGKIDIGELTAQHLSLCLDPYPHAPGVEYELSVDTHEEVAKGGEGADLRKNPFEALKDWKEKR